MDILDRPEGLSTDVDYRQFDLGSGPPIGDGEVDVVTAFDFLEHIPRQVRDSRNSTRYPFIELMNDVSRVLRNGGFFIAVTPAFPSPDAFADPTHVNYISKGTIDYFCGDDAAVARRLGYGFSGSFEKTLNKWISPHSPIWGYAETGSMFREMSGPLQWEEVTRLPSRRAYFVRSRTSPFQCSHLLWVMKKT